MKLHSGKQPRETSIMCISLVMGGLLCNTRGLLSAVLAASAQLLSAVDKDFLSNETTVSTGAPRVKLCLQVSAAKLVITDALLPFYMLKRYCVLYLILRFILFKSPKSEGLFHKYLFVT